MAIVAALERKQGNVKQASTALGINRSTLYDKLKRYQISPRTSDLEDSPELPPSPAAQPARIEVQQ
jgi:transposase-like protein